MKKILKYINIDQKACISYELQHDTRLTIKHSTILDYIRKQIAYKKSSRLKNEYTKIINDQVYVKIDYQAIINELPLLLITSKKVIARYIKDLVKWGLLDKKIVKNVLYYRLEDQAYKFMLFNNNNKDTHKNYKLDDKYKDIKNFITINQQAFINLAKKHNRKITLKECTILDYIYYFIHSQNNRILRKSIDKKKYTWIAYGKARKDLPILKIKSNRTIARYINLLIDLGVLEKHIIYVNCKPRIYLRITDHALKSIFKPIEQDELTACNDQEIYTEQDEQGGLSQDQAIEMIQSNNKIKHITVFKHLNSIYNYKNNDHRSTNKAFKQYSNLKNDDKIELVRALYSETWLKIHKKQDYYESLGNFIYNRNFDNDWGNSQDSYKSVFRNDTEQENKGVTCAMIKNL